MCPAATCHLWVPPARLLGLHHVGHVAAVQLVDQLLLLLQGQVAGVEGTLDGLLDVFVSQLELVRVTLHPGTEQRLLRAEGRGEAVEEDGRGVLGQLAGARGGPGHGLLLQLRRLLPGLLSLQNILREHQNFLVSA